MGRIYKFYIKKILRTKGMLFWSLAFPLMLGTMFYFAFGNIYGQQESKTMKVAVVGENAKDHAFVKVLQDLTYENGKKMIELVFTSEDEAKHLLTPTDQEKAENKKNAEEGKTSSIIGMIKIQGETDVSLTIAENDLYQSILSGIVSSYRQKAEFMADSMARGEEAFQAAAKSVSQDMEYVVSAGMAGENKDPYIAYFYNLIAMVCMLGSTMAMEMTISIQPNETNTGLRIGASGVGRLKYEAAIVLAVFTIQLICVGVTLFYLIGILKLRFGGEVPLICATTVAGTLMGIALGYLVAHIGHFKYSTKSTILTIITLAGGAISGLYAVQLKAVIEAKSPIINRINPMSVITDAFYSLNIFGVGERYYRAMITMGALTAALFIIGAILGRRNQYESL